MHRHVLIASSMNLQLLTLATVTSPRETDLLLSICLWLMVRPGHQAAISNAVDAVCPNSCHHHGDCVTPTSGSAVACSCHVGWGGDTCEVPCVRPCLHGACVFAGDQQLCLCSLGFKGETCSEPGYDMEALLNLAKVISASSTALGAFVQDPRVEVQANIKRGSNTCMGNFVCQNEGRCVNGQMGGYRCQCNISRQTGNFCQYSCPKPCLNGGMCLRLRKVANEVEAVESISLPESHAVYRCACADGFSGDRCSRSTRPLSLIGLSSGT